jgi:GWxTD domain-containing protein
MVNYFKRTTVFICAAITILFFANSCRTTKPVFDLKDISYIYDPTNNLINPLFSVFNETDSLSVLSIKLFTNELYFNEANPLGVPTSMLHVTVKLYNLDLGRIIADTAVLSLDLKKEEGRQEYILNIDLKAKTGFNYLAEVLILDRIRLKVIQSFVPFDKVTDYNRFSFKARGYFLHDDLYNPLIKANEFVSLIYPKKQIDSLFISFYKPFKEVPYPPSMLLPEKIMSDRPDRVVAIQYSDTLPMMFPREGIFLCTIGRDVPDGYTFFNFGPGFPEMTTPESMIEPLAYISNDTELDSMRKSRKQKVALDEFWIKTGGNIDKARELIRIYYTRVRYADYYFNSFKEGWRTDRGMIFIVYGPPDKVYKTDDGERWGYRKPVVKTTWGTRYLIKEEYLYFNFTKKKNKFSDNEYTLNRSENSVTYWDQAVRSWRNGIAFRLDNPTDI